MRTSLLALSVSGLLAASALFSAPAEAKHRWSPERGWNAGHGSRARVVVAPRRDVVVVRERKPRRHVVVINPDGSRSYVRVSRRPPPPRVVYVR